MNGSRWSRGQAHRTRTNSHWRLKDAWFGVLTQATTPRQTTPPTRTASLMSGSCRQSENIMKYSPGFRTRWHASIRAPLKSARPKIDDDRLAGENPGIPHSLGGLRPLMGGSYRRKEPGLAVIRGNGTGRDPRFDPFFELMKLLRVTSATQRFRRISGMSILYRSSGIRSAASRMLW